MERGREEGRSSGAGSVMEEEFGECGVLGRLQGWGAGGLNLGVRGVHPKDADTGITMCPKHPLYGASFWVLRGSLVLSRAHQPQADSLGSLS